MSCGAPRVRTRACRRSSWTTPFVWKNEERTEIVTIGHGWSCRYDLDGRELWRVSGMSMPTASPLLVERLLYVGTGSQGDANRPFLAIRPGATGDITLRTASTSNDFIAWRIRARPATRRRRRPRRQRVSRARHRHPAVLDAITGKEIYKVRVGGGGHTFSASPVAAGDRILLLTERRRDLRDRRRQ